MMTKPWMPNLLMLLLISSKYFLGKVLGMERGKNSLDEPIWDGGIQVRTLPTPGKEEQSPLCAQLGASQPYPAANLLPADVFHLEERESSRLEGDRRRILGCASLAMGVLGAGWGTGGR